RSTRLTLGDLNKDLDLALGQEHPAPTDLDADPGIRVYPPAAGPRLLPTFGQHPATLDLHHSSPQPGMDLVHRPRRGCTPAEASPVGPDQGLNWCAPPVSN